MGNLKLVRIGDASVPTHLHPTPAPTVEPFLSCFCRPFSLNLTPMQSASALPLLRGLGLGSSELLKEWLESRAERGIPFLQFTD